MNGTNGPASGAARATEEPSLAGAVFIRCDDPKLRRAIESAVAITVKDYGDRERAKVAASAPNPEIGVGSVGNPRKSGFMEDEDRRDAAIRDAIEAGRKTGPVSPESAPALLRKRIEKLFPRYLNSPFHPECNQVKQRNAINASARSFCHTLVTDCGEGNPDELFEAVEAVRNAVFFACESLRLGNK